MLAPETKRGETVRKTLVLAALIGAVLFSWLLGHVLRFSIPALWQPPLQELNPQTEYGFEIELAGIRRLAVFPGLAPAGLATQLQRLPAPGAPPGECQGLTYFTSLPAKCLTPDGRLIEVGGIEFERHRSPGKQVARENLAGCPLLEESQLFLRFYILRQKILDMLCYNRARLPVFHNELQKLS